jgi:3-oxoacyl-[acyl-carrier protein] reductase
MDRETVELLAAKGAFVGVHYRSSAAAAEDTLNAIWEAGGDGVLVQGDFTDESAVNHAVDAFVDAAGRLDIPVNTAGSPIEKVRIEDCSLDLWNEVLATNLTSAFMVTRRAIPHLRHCGNGAIINNLSLSVQPGGANGAEPYAAAKGGLQVFTRTFAKELVPEVRTNAIMPGVIETAHHDSFTSPERMKEYMKETPLGRNGRPDEVASAIECGSEPQLHHRQPLADIFLCL